jgi:hypothetical protein
VLAFTLLPAVAALELGVAAERQVTDISLFSKTLIDVTLTSLTMLMLTLEKKNHRLS